MASGYYHAQISRSDESALFGGLTEGAVATFVYTSIPPSHVQGVLFIMVGRVTTLCKVYNVAEP
jgi:hypothetical protein